MFGLVLFFSTAIVAPAQDLCPVLSMGGGPGGKGLATYSADLSGGDSKVSPTFNWVISAGTIASGQGTPSITVEADPGTTVTATLEIGGYAPSCTLTESSTLEVGADALCPVLGVESGKTARGETLFKATADPIPSGDFTFNWSVSAGTISAGQGTGNILVEAPKGTSVTATMDVGGLAPECPRTASGTAKI